MYYIKYIILYGVLIFSLLNIPYQAQFINNYSIFNTKFNKQCLNFFSTYKIYLENIESKNIFQLLENNINKYNINIVQKLMYNNNYIKSLKIKFYIYSIQQIRKNYVLVLYLFKIKILIQLPQLNKWAERRGAYYLLLKIYSYPIIAPLIIISGI